MGDRANIYVKNDDGAGVYLYTHWGGSELPETLRAALDRAKAGGRLTDGPYLTRIIFCEMVRGSEMETTGYGISTYMPDNQHPILIVDPKAQKVSIASPDADEPVTDEPLQVFTFEEYVNAPFRSFTYNEDTNIETVE